MNSRGEPGYHDSIDTKWWYPRSFVQGHFCITIKLKNQGSGALRILHPYYKIKVYQNEKKHKFSIESWYPGYSRGCFLSQMGSIESWYPRFNVKTTSYKLLWHSFWVVDQQSELQPCKIVVRSKNLKEVCYGLLMFTRLVLQNSWLLLRTLLGDLGKSWESHGISRLKRRQHQHRPCPKA